MYRYFYIGQLKDGGNLEELTGVVGTQLKGTNIGVIQIKKDAPSEEIFQKLGAFWAFIGSLQLGFRETAIKNISESGKIPTARNGPAELAARAHHFAVQNQDGVMRPAATYN